MREAATMNRLLACVVLVAAAFVIPPRSTTDERQPTQPASITVSERIRLLVIAPHPDDETLGAGGLMQRVRAVGGPLQIVFLADGDGFPEGVKVHGRVTHPTAADYRGYGELRKHEAAQAIASLALAAYELTFLGFAGRRSQ